MTDHTTAESTQRTHYDTTHDLGDARPPTLPPPPPPERRRRRFPIFLLVVLVALIAAAIAYPAGPRAALQSAQEDEQPAAEQQDEAPAALDAPSPVPEIADAVLPSVARVDVTQGAGQGSGSAVIYREDGYLVTNNHVVQGAQQVEVTLADGQRRSADVVGTTPFFDLAVLRIDETGLPAATFADDVPDIGSTAVAVGSPFGLDATVTAGIISATDRELAGGGVTLGGLIQTDAAINPGNSGGALADDQGRVVGINTAILSQSGTNSGVGFAVPASSVVHVADQIIENGEVRLGYLGIRGENVTGETAQAFGVPEGAVVVEVTPGSPADDAGLQAEDVVTAIDGEDVDSMEALTNRILLSEPGDEVSLTYFRDGQERQTTVTLAERPTELTPQ